MNHPSRGTLAHGNQAATPTRQSISNQSIELIAFQTQRVAIVLEELMFKMYDHQTPIIQAKLQELTDTLQRIEQLESELRDFKQALSVFHADMTEK